MKRVAKNLAPGWKISLVAALVALAVSTSAWAKGGGHGGGGHSSAGARWGGTHPVTTTSGAKPRVGAGGSGGQSVVVAGYVSPRYYPPVVYWPAAIFFPTTDASWSSPVALEGPDQWTETSFAVHALGRNVALQVNGDAALDWAEIVFSDGTTQVVDFENRTAQAGIYNLLDFDDVRLVDHIRVMARGLTPGASVNIALQQ